MMLHTVFSGPLHNSITVWPSSHTGVGSDSNGVLHKLLQSSQYSHCRINCDSVSHGNRGKGGLCVFNLILSDDSILVYERDWVPGHLNFSWGGAIRSNIYGRRTRNYWWKERESSYITELTESIRKPLLTIFICSDTDNIAVGPRSHPRVGSDSNGVLHKLQKITQNLCKHCWVSRCDSGVVHWDSREGGLIVLHVILRNYSILVYGRNLSPIDFDRRGGQAGCHHSTRWRCRLCAW